MPSRAGRSSTQSGQLQRMQSLSSLVLHPPHEHCRSSLPFPQNGVRTYANNSFQENAKKYRPMSYCYQSYEHTWKTEKSVLSHP